VAVGPSALFWGIAGCPAETAGMHYHVKDDR